jgi:asparagine synthase (glutamine-hydrolysing)
VDALLTPARLAEAGVFAAPAVERLMQKCRRNESVGVTESDEMALVGVLSTMLLHEQMVARPALAAAARPNKVVVGSTVVSLDRAPRGGAHETEGATASA